MFNFGFLELLALGVIALLVIGPKQLPEVARVVGRLLSELRRAGDEITGSFHAGKKNFEAEVKEHADDLTSSLPSKESIGLESLKSDDTSSSQKSGSND